jgi:excisionase family DNA binding protein
MHDTALTVKDVSDRLQISVSQVVALIDTGKLRAFDTGTKSRRELRVLPAAIDEFIELSTVAAGDKIQRPAKREIHVRRFLTGVV